MPVNKVTRRRVNEPTVDTALKDIYDELDKLQPITNKYTDLRETVDGILGVVENSDGTVTSTVNMNGQSYVDINSNFQPVGSRGYLATVGTNGRSKKPIRGESVKYNRSKIPYISNLDSSDRVLLKNVSGVLNVRNATDTADADIRVANVKDANDKKSIEITATGSAVSHLKVENAATGTANAVHLSAQGDDNDISISMSSKGDGNIVFTTPGSGNISLKDEAGVIPMQFGTSSKKMTFSTAGGHLGLLQSDAANLFKIWSYDAGANATDIAINSVRDIYLAAKGGEIYLNKGNSAGGSYNIGTNFGHFDFGTSSTLKLKSASNKHLQLEAQGTGVLVLTGAEGINIIPTDNSDVLIDRNTDITTTSTQKGLHIDYDHTGISASGQTVTGIGLDLDMNCNAVTHVGTVNQTGIDIDMVALTDGTQTNTGINISCTGADTNTHLKLSHDSTNYCTMTTGANGATTLATTDSDGAVGHLTLDADGDIEFQAAGGDIKADAPVSITSTTADQLRVKYDGSNYAVMNIAADGALEIESVGTDADITLNAAADIELNADGGNIDFKDGLGELAAISKGVLRTIFDGNNYHQIQVSSAGICTLSTVGGTAANADFIIDAGGDITLDSGTGIFIAKNAGTEFSAANSAYAGMILGYTRIQNDGTTSGQAAIDVDSSNMTVLQTAQGTDLSIQFIVPPSGKVEIQCSFWMAGTSDGVKFSLSTGTSYAELDETHTYDADQTIYLDETDHNYNTVSFSVTGLTAGTDTTYYLAGLASGAGMFIAHGRNRTGGTHYPPIILKAIALPATIVTGE